MACTCGRAGWAEAGSGLSSQVERAEKSRHNVPKGGWADGGQEEGSYLIGGVGVPHNQLPILRGTY